MRSKSVFSSCAIILLSAVLSTGWVVADASSICADPTSAVCKQQQAIDAANAAAANNTTGGTGTGTGTGTKSDTNTVMKTNEQELKDSQGTAESAQTNADALKSGIESGDIQAGPATAYAAELAADLVKRQTAFCKQYPATYAQLINIYVTSSPSALQNICATYNPGGTGGLIGAAFGGVNPYCYTFGSKTSSFIGWVLVCKNKY